ncbi:hypothetical protein SLEP1_g54958 [Rubroshorea leprosula]|uniref:Uncharacterized protein n=1 Tax=Rubroshorea leprosula TaxID=152421 RepID=A0AAV5MHR9_9ROSI|nr:hypothetical protein SLEP1_g54958 [Rubroshorea leprosula]
MLDRHGFGEERDSAALRKGFGSNEGEKMMKIDDGHGFGEEGDSAAMRKIGFQFVVEKRKR